MRTQTQYTLTILLFLVSYGHTKASDLDYSTEKLRVMRLDSHNVFTKEYLEIAERIKLPLCDCYIDYLRVEICQNGLVNSHQTTSIY